MKMYSDYNLSLEKEFEWIKKVLQEIYRAKMLNDKKKGNKQAEIIVKSA